MQPWMKNKRGKVGKTTIKIIPRDCCVLPCRRVAEAPLSPKGGVSDAQAEVLESIVRKASKKKAKELFDKTQQEYIRADAKARTQEEAMRKVHQKQVDKAMDVSPSLSLTHPPPRH